ncbi:MAG: DUF6084 family protein [Ktedonobacteraceae bacterium]
MPELNFEIVGAEVAIFAAQPTLLFKLRVSNAQPQEQIQSVMLRSQVQIMATQRRYSPAAKEQLLDVFGEPQRWSETLRSFLWTHANTIVPAFVDETTVDLPIVCSYDFEVTSTKYFAALQDGEIPLNFLFSGTIFYTNAAGLVQIGQVAWSKEAAYRLPVSQWRQMIQHYYPNSAWIRLHKDVFDQVYLYKTRHGLPTLEDALTRLLQASSEEVQR